MDTQENNKLIAEFMGVKPLHLGASLEYEMYGVLDCIEDGENEKHFFIEEELIFHTSWDWLMPVVENVKNIGTDSETTEKEFNILNNIDEGLMMVRIDLVLEALAMYIKFHNEQPK